MTFTRGHNAAYCRLESRCEACGALVAAMTDEFVHRMAVAGEAGEQRRRWLQLSMRAEARHICEDKDLPYEQ